MSGQSTGATGMSSTAKIPMWAIAAFLVGVALQWTLIRNGGLSLNDLVASFANGHSPGTIKDEAMVLPKVNKVVIGAVSCQKPGTGNVYNEETAMMIKSVVISAMIYDIPSLEFRLFLEDIPEGRKFFRGKLKEWGFPKDKLKISLHYHSAMDAVPKKYHDNMIYHKKYRCGFVRHFFPTALPNVDSILYFDTDMLVTGNIGELWLHLGKMTGEQLVGVARNNEPEDIHYDIIHTYGFGDIPHVPPKGVNSGMILMNLTKMREYDWQTRITRLYEDYMKIVGWLEDQRTLNIILYYDPGLHQLIPCQFNFIHTHCDKGWNCPPALEDSYGVHVIHGAGDQFDEGGTYYHIYEAYKNVNLTLINGDKSPIHYFLDELVVPIRNAYEPSAKQKSKPESECFGTLNRLLFRNLAMNINSNTNYSK